MGTNGNTPLSVIQTRPFGIRFFNMSETSFIIIHLIGSKFYDHILKAYRYYNSLVFFRALCKFF